MLRLFIIVLLLVSDAGATAIAQSTSADRPIDARRAAPAGVRILAGRYIEIATDLPSSPAVDELPTVFDAAVPLWAEYFGVPVEKVAGQRWTACLIDDRARFNALGLLPEDNRDFVNGYAQGDRLWLVEQPSDYYRRHLLLHEGTHAFMQTMLGGAGPGWYMEGVAELLGTHEWKNGQLRLGVMPDNRESVPMWGRTKLIRDAVAADKAWPLERVLTVDNNRALDVDHYAWTWALATLLDGHPQFRERFRKLSRHAADADFNAQFRKLFANDWEQLLVEWSAYVPQLEYGYDMARMALVERELSDPGRLGPGGSQPSNAAIAANRGWQSTGWRLKAGDTYRITASGRYTVANDGEPWPCEAGGITIEYVAGRPLGMLLGAMREVDESSGKATPGQSPGLQTPFTVGLSTTVTPEQNSVLYLRVNDSPAKLADNEGELSVRIETVASN